MINALAEYLEGKGYTNICTDFMPDVTNQRDCIYLGKWAHSVADINDGTGTQYIQIQVRRPTYAEALSVCSEIFKLLDSGLDEKIMHLTEAVWCIARPGRGPLLLDRGIGFATFYYELALWGEN